MKIINPLFKFRKSDDAEKMLLQGQIRIGTLNDYRNPNKHSGTILDPHEGYKKITLKIDSLEAKGHEIIDRGIAEYFHEPVTLDGNYTINNYKKVLTQQILDCYLYCTCFQFYLTEVNQYKVNDNFDSCVMIINPELFYEKVTKHLENVEYSGNFKCVYGDREITVDMLNQTEHIADAIHTHPGIIKPHENYNQSENRGVWDTEEKDIEPIILTIPELQKLFIEIDISKIDTTLLDNNDENIEFGIEIILKNDEVITIFTGELRELFTPIIVEDNGETFLFFKPETETNVFKNFSMSANPDIGYAVTDSDGILLFGFKLKNIKKIVYFTDNLYSK